MSTLTTTAEDIQTYMASLGNTADEVYESLKAAGVKGPRGNPYECPGAVGILHRFPDLKAESLSEGGNFGLGGQEFRLGERSGYQWYATPPAFAEFVGRFDAGDFPDLRDFRNGS